MLILSFCILQSYFLQLVKYYVEQLGYLFRQCFVQDLLCLSCQEIGEINHSNCLLYLLYHDYSSLLLIFCNAADLSWRKFTVTVIITYLIFHTAVFFWLTFISSLLFHRFLLFLLDCYHPLY